VDPHHAPAGDGLELGYFTDVLAVNTTIVYYQGENMRYVLRSCYRYILLVCKPIGTLKISKNSRLGAFGKLQEPENQLQIDNLPVLEPVLIYQSGCKLIEYRGSSYEIRSTSRSSPAPGHRSDEARRLQ
jgi:hypothetical protein